MAVSTDWRSFFSCAPTIRSVLFGAYFTAPDFGKLPYVLWGLLKEKGEQIARWLRNRLRAPTELSALRFGSHAECREV